MRILLYVLLFSMMGIHCFSQQNPVQWESTFSKISKTEYELVATAYIQNGWRMYSQSVPENGPVATSFSFEKHSDYSTKGKTVEEEGNEVDDKVFNMRVKYFENKTTFKQHIQIENPHEPVEVKCVVEYMVCDDTQCLPPKEINLVFHLE